MKKIGLLKLSIILLSSSLVILSPNAYASDSTETKMDLKGNLFRQSVKLPLEKPQSVELSNKLDRLNTNFYDTGMFAWGMIAAEGVLDLEYRGDTSYSFKDHKITQTGDPVIQNESSLFAGKNTLTNNTDVEQTLSTSSFSKTYTTTTSSTVTHGSTVSAGGSIKFSIPIIGETGLSLTTTYNFSNTQTDTESEAITYVAPAQNIKVPAHTTATVLVYLNTVDIEGKVDLTATGFGTMRKVAFGTLSGGNIIIMVEHDVPVQEFLDYRDIFIEAGIISDSAPIKNNKNGTFTLNGSGTYGADYGLEFLVDVQFEDQKNGEVTQTSFTVPIQTN